MYITDLRKDFYEKITGERVLVLVSEDVDGLCACKILQYLLQSDHVQYTLLPVRGKTDLLDTYVEHAEQVQHVVMLNCGATYDVLELLEPPSEKTIFYIADTHRPIDVINIYNESQVKLLMKPDPVENVPSFSQLFRDDEESEEESGEDEENEDGTAKKRKKFDTEYLERKRERRLWMEERQKIMFDYTQFSFYGLSSSSTFFELAWKMSKDNNDLLWWAIIGLTDQYLTNKVEHNTYILEMGNLQGHVTRHNHIRNEGENAATVDSLKLSFEKDALMKFNRHCSTEYIVRISTRNCKSSHYSSKSRGHSSNIVMSEDGLTRQVFISEPTSRRPRTRWRNQIQNLASSRYSTQQLGDGSNGEEYLDANPLISAPATPGGISESEDLIRSAIQLHIHQGCCGPFICSQLLVKPAVLENMLLCRSSYWHRSIRRLPQELRLNLYRHWSLIESLKHTMYTACKFKLWTQKGEKRLYEFLADLGLPLSQCKQRFSSMDMQLKAHVQTWVAEKSSKYGLDDIEYGSFVAKYGFRHRFSAADVTYSIKALLESNDKGKSTADKFLDALDCLTRSQIGILHKGMELAKKQQIAIFKQVQAFLDMNHVICAGPFLYAVIPEGTPDLKFFSHPSSLDTLAKFLLKAHISSSRSRKAKNLPLVLTSAAADEDDNEAGMCLVIGVPPLSEDSPRNLFGKAFEQASLKTNSVIKQDYFDTSIIQMRADDRSKFFDALISLLS